MISSSSIAETAIDATDAQSLRATRAALLCSVAWAFTGAAHGVVVLRVDVIVLDDDQVVRATRIQVHKLLRVRTAQRQSSDKQDESEMKSRIEKKHRNALKRRP